MALQKTEQELLPRLFQLALSALEILLAADVIAGCLPSLELNAMIIIMARPEALPAPGPRQTVTRKTVKKKRGLARLEQVKKDKEDLPIVPGVAGGETSLIKDSMQWKYYHCVRAQQLKQERSPCQPASLVETLAHVHVHVHAHAPVSPRFRFLRGADCPCESVTPKFRSMHTAHLGGSP